jgi:hypothetical protein
MSEATSPPAKESTGADEAQDKTTQQPKADAAAAENLEKPTGKNPPEGKPSEQKLALKLPDGSVLDPGAVERIAAYAKERGLSQEQAQELLNREHGAVAAYVEGQKQVLNSARTSWLEEVKSDKEIGGEKYNEAIELSRRLISDFGSEALKQALNETGLGNHPELIRFVYRLAKTRADDKIVRPSAGAGQRKSMEQVFYPEPQKTEA